jgi:hypothetical protein
MKRKTVVAVLGIAAIGGTAYRLRRVRPARPGDGRHVVRVNRAPDEVAASLPSPLTDLGDAIEVKLRPAPGGRGTEIHARVVGEAVSDADLRRALRISRSLLEVGDVLRPGTATTTPTLLNRALQGATRRGREEGML